jgi:cytochrome c2
MWNHMPKMWATYETAQKPIHPITSFEAADLFAYFYAALYFAPPGDDVRGRAVFQEKGCIGCHGDILDTRSGSRRNNKWPEIEDPITWAELMWNHSSEMDSAVSNRGIRWPTLSERDIVDLLTFLSKSSSERQAFSNFTMGEPERGRGLFERSCESCHSFGEGDKSKVNLLARSRPSSFTDYLADMWNHAPAMRRRGGSTAKLNPGEMGDLIAFLFSQRYFFEQGNVPRGRALFEAKGCAGCHEIRRRETGAPDLSQSTEVYSPITLTSAAWRHGPSMLATMREQHIPWPEFQGAEMADLISYLNSRLVLRIGR